MDNLTILNYQGSKKNLLNFIHEKMAPFITENDVILDVFSGTSSVAYSFKRQNTVYANDAEIYAATIAQALLGKKADRKKIYTIKDIYLKYEYPDVQYCNWINLEKKYIMDKDVDNLIKLYAEIPTVWRNGKKFFENHEEYSLFVKYYSTSYFGIEQAKDIDAIRWAISKNMNEYQDIYLSCLYFAMKECVFSKDGHMAQPLDMNKNRGRLLKQRAKNIYDIFEEKLFDFVSDEYVESLFENRVFNNNFEDLLDNTEIEPVTVIYADPPYTDMQYSRYYHLLNTVTRYDYPELTKNNGSYTKGLYLENRFQSKLSRKSSCLEAMISLIAYSYRHNITLVISFAYPKDVQNQKTDRYVMNVFELIKVCKEYYADNVYVEKQDYKHSNNRNSSAKNVEEYLIICERLN